LDRLRTIVALLFAVVMVESALIVLPLAGKGSRGALRPVGAPQTLTFGYSVFNQPIANDTDAKLSQNYSGSWQVVITSTLSYRNTSPNTESQVALAPQYAVEALSIPTLIIQERSDGLIRVEYYAQNWPGTYGLVLYNSTSPGWQGQNVTLKFSVYGPSSAVNPQIAPRPTGNLTVFVGGTEVVSNYSIAWASLGELYLYGLPGSDFVGGDLGVTVQGMS